MLHQMEHGQVQQSDDTSWMLAAMLVDPEASAVVNLFVARPNGRSLINGEMSTADTLRPSSAGEPGASFKRLCPWAVDTTE
jgi:hypothetical protein